MHINPDHFLLTDAGRVTTHARNNVAWKESYRAFHRALAAAEPDTEVYVLIGPQGAGKSSWATSAAVALPRAIFWDAILVRVRERAPILAAAESRGLRSVAVWFRTPLDLCLERNAARPADEIVGEQGIRNVFAALEPPTTDEGFDRIIDVFPTELALARGR